jgi:hypothetical protein
MIQRLVVAAGGMERIGDFKVMSIQTGTLDSCYTLALLRAAQLSIASRAPATFHLRVATLRLNGTGSTALDNIHRSNTALFLYDDPRVELLMVDNREVLPFDHLAPISEAGRESNRLNLLMVGHRRDWNDPLDLWDDGYLTTAEFYGQIARWDGGVDVLITSESPRQQKQFLDGLGRAAKKASLEALSYSAMGFESLFAVLDELGSDYYREFYAGHEHVAWRPAGRFEACRRTTSLDIHDMVVGKLEERWPLLTEFLGVQPDEMAAHLSDNEYISPVLAAHLRGLQACFVMGSSYESGLAEYLQRALVMMRRKQVPERICELALVSFGNPAAMAEQRMLAAVEAQETLGLTEAQLICLLFAPFVDKGAGLERFLRSCHPGMLVAMPELHKAMQGYQAPEQVVQWMNDVSGLPVSLISTLYRMRPMAEADGGFVDGLSGESGISAEDSQEEDASLIGERSAGH